MSYIITTDKYWDCECDSDYIHPASEKTCQLCGAEREEQPDSRLEEVLNYLGETVIIKVRDYCGQYIARAVRKNKTASRTSCQSDAVDALCKKLFGENPFTKRRTEFTNTWIAEGVLYEK